MDNNRYVYHFVCSHDYTTMIHCVGGSIGGAAAVVVVVVLVLLLYCKISNTLKKHDKAGQLPTTVSIHYYY